MLVRKLGDTSVNVSAIGQGTGYQFQKKSEVDKASNVLRLGINLGLNFIDTAEDYANGLAEVTVGKAIKGIRHKAFVGTKFSVANSKFNNVVKACENSLKRLKTDYIDLYQLHWPNPNVPLEETFSALTKLRQKGFIRQIGISNFSLFELMHYKKLLSDAKVVSLQCEFNLFERTVETNGTFNFCKKNRLAFIAYSPLDQGRLVSMNSRQKILLRRLSLKYSKNISQIILAWVISRNFVIAIPKTLSNKHLRENEQAAEFNLEKNDVRKINKAFLAKVKYVPVDKINVSVSGERNRLVYKTLKEAMENRLNFIPSPQELAHSLKKGVFLRPVRLVPAKKKSYYDLVNGRIRYWAWVIAYGEKKPIPAYIRNDF